MRSLVALTILIVVAPASGQPTLVPIPERGGEFQMSTTRLAFNPSITRLKSGGFVSVWKDRVDTSDDDVRGQRFDLDTGKLGDEFVVNSTQAGVQRDSDVAMLRDGGFVVVWEDHEPGNDDGSCGFVNEFGGTVTEACSVRAQLYNADGSPRGGERLVNATTSKAQFQPAVAPNGDGFVVVFRDGSRSGGDTSSSAIRGRRFTADGAPVGSEFLVNVTTADRQLRADVSAIDGGFVVAWQDFSQTGGDQSSDAIRARVFNSDASPRTGELLVNSTTSGGQRWPDSAGLGDGGFVIVWHDFSGTGGDTDGRAVRAQIFNSDGSQRGGEMLANSVTEHHQRFPAVTGLRYGGFAVTWTDESNLGGDDDGGAIKARLFHADGSTRGGEYRVNTTTEGHQSFSAPAALVEGGFVVGWNDDSPISGTVVRGQIYSGYLFGDRFEELD